MERKYRVDIVDKNGNLILRFKGIVIKKEQSSGQLGIGDVVEILFVDDFHFKKGKKFKFG